MQKSRIIYFQQNVAVGACEEYFYLLMQGIDKTRFEVFFVCPQDAVLDSLVSRIAALNIKIYRYSWKNSNFQLILYLKKLFRSCKPDIIHFNDPCINGIIAARLAGKSILVMTHHTPELIRKYNLKGWLLEKIAFKYCGLYVIFTSEFSKETGMQKDKVSSDKSFVIYYGLPIEKFNPAHNKNEVYREFSLNDEYRIVGNIARFSPQKGQSYLVKAAPLVIEQIKTVKFFLIGNGELESELKLQVKKNYLEDYFIFTGYRNDIPRILSVFEILVMPSLFEGLCFAVIEASAMGIPVVGTAVGGLQRSVINGKTGLLIPIGDYNTLANALIWLLRHPQRAKEMGLAGRKHFEEFFTYDRMIEKTEELYKTLSLSKRSE